MKTIYLLIAFFICSSPVIGQTKPIIEDKKANNNTYHLFYYLGNISISNKTKPLNSEANPLAWQDFYRIDIDDLKNLAQYIEPYIGPYLKNYQLEKYDNLETSILFDLHGNVNGCRFTYPSKINIPLTVIEQIETSLKANGKVKITPIGPPRDDMHNVIISLFVSLKKLQTQF